MDPEVAKETGDIFLTWLNDYGALKLWAVWGMICTVGLSVLPVWIVIKIGRPLARIAFWLEKNKEVQGP